MKVRIKINQTESYGAHGNCHLGLSDYNDGGPYWHWGGNDDYYNEEKIEQEIFIEEFDGTQALGNLGGIPIEDAKN